MPFDFENSIEANDNQIVDNGDGTYRIVHPLLEKGVTYWAEISDGKGFTRYHFRRDDMGVDVERETDIPLE